MTLVTSPDAVDKFSSAYEKFTVEKATSPNWVKKLREQAWSTFSEIGIPTKRRGNELWKYTNLQPLTALDFDAGHSGSVTTARIKNSAPWDDDWHTLVVVDGKFSSELSRINDIDGLQLISLNEAIETETDDLKSLLATLAGKEEYAFSALNTAFLDDGAYVSVAEGVKIEQPIHVVHVTSESVESRAVYPRLLVDARAGSSIVLIETHLNIATTSQFSAPVVEIFQGESSSLRHYRVQMENEISFHLGTTRVSQQSDTDFTSTSFAVGAQIARNDIHSLLDAPGASCTLHGLYMTNGVQHQDQEISTTHAKPGGTSDQFYKGILSGKSQAVFSGKVIVMRDAQKSDASQKDLNLLLSRGAEVDAKPSLEIYADDITASHGATAGHVDRDTLFYLQSRGVDEESAKAILVRGFAEEMLNEFEPTALYDFVERVTDERIPVLLSESDTIGTA
tara:strand:+ start:11262 stop:12614 length:1353 start_codon:yes stop_codon:yes gene_type:complete